MTKKQTQEHKFGNQRRREVHLKLARTADRRDRSWYASTLGAIQAGKYSTPGLVLPRP